VVTKYERYGSCESRKMCGNPLPLKGGIDYSNPLPPEKGDDHSNPLPPEKRFEKP